MIVAICKEVVVGETRVALVPESVAKLTKLGYEVLVEAGAGEASGFSDADYKEEGASIAPDAAAAFSAGDVILRVQKPGPHPSGKHELELAKKGATWISFFYPLTNTELVTKAAACGVNVVAMDAVPRTTKAQRMDALSSQTNLAGYKAVIIAAEALGKIFPLMMTAAGTIAPARVVIMGAGVAGLQAIATAKRLGAVVEVSDVRPEVKEQVESLGGTYIEVETDEDLSGEGGYAKEASADFLAKQKAVLEERVSGADAVITTALVPGRKAPVLVSEAMVKAMRSGSVIVDMAAEQGGNCELTEADQSVLKHGVRIIGPTNLPAAVPVNASELYSRNLVSLLTYFTKEGQLDFPVEDEIAAGALIVRDGTVVHEKTKELLG